MYNFCTFFVLGCFFMTDAARVLNITPQESFVTDFPSITITENAANKVWELLEEEGNFRLKLRVFITGGGCSGFQYGFTFDEVSNPDDTVVTKTFTKKKHENSEDGEGDEGESSGTMQLLIDAMSLPYLIGSEIDYKSDLKGEQFIIRNPNAKTTCGCGSSFSA